MVRIVKAWVDEICSEWKKWSILHEPPTTSPNPPVPPHKINPKAALHCPNLSIPTRHVYVVDNYQSLPPIEYFRTGF